MLFCSLSRSVFTAVLLGASLLPVATLQAKTLVYCSEGSPENFTPALNTTGTSFDAARPVYDRLIDFKRGTTDIVNGLAQEIKVSDDGLELTIILRKGVKFHSGVNGFVPSRDFNADDVLFSIDRQWKPGHAYAKVSGGAYDYFNDMMANLLKSVDKVDDHTVKMMLNEPNAAMVANLAMDFMAIHSAEYADYLVKKGAPEEFDQIPVGTGPFHYVDYQKDAVIRYKAFAPYWAGKTPVDNLVFAIVPDPTARYAKMRVGECQIMAHPNPADLNAMRQDKNITVLSEAGLNVGYLSLNFTKPPFDKKNVRRALNMAIDRDAIIKEIYQGAGQKADNILPPTIWSYNKDLKGYAYKPEEAQKMLADAGVKNLKTELWWMPVQRAYNPNAKRMAEMMQADLAKVGVEARLVSYEWGEYRKRLQAGEAPMGLFGWTGDNGDPDNFMMLLSCNKNGKPATHNTSKWCNEDFDQKMLEARRLSDQSERAKIYSDMQKIFVEEAPWITIANSTVYQPVAKGVLDYRISPLGSHDFYGVDIAE